MYQAKIKFKAELISVGVPLVGTRPFPATTPHYVKML